MEQHHNSFAIGCREAAEGSMIPLHRVGTLHLTAHLVEGSSHRCSARWQTSTSKLPSVGHGDAVGANSIVQGTNIAC
jgi:hypothetical protein